MNYWIIYYGIKVSKFQNHKNPRSPTFKVSSFQVSKITKFQLHVFLQEIDPMFKIFKKSSYGSSDCVPMRPTCSNIFNISYFQNVEIPQNNILSQNSYDFLRIVTVIWYIWFTNRGGASKNQKS